MTADHGPLRSSNEKDVSTWSVSCYLLTGSSVQGHLSTVDLGSDHPRIGNFVCSHLATQNFVRSRLVTGKFVQRRLVIGNFVQSHLVTGNVVQRCPVTWNSVGDHGSIVDACIDHQRIGDFAGSHLARKGVSCWPCSRPAVCIAVRIVYRPDLYDPSCQRSLG